MGLWAGLQMFFSQHFQGKNLSWRADCSLAWHLAGACCGCQLCRCFGYVISECGVLLYHTVDLNVGGWTCNVYSPNPSKSTRKMQGRSPGVHSAHPCNSQAEQRAYSHRLSLCLFVSQISQHVGLASKGSCGAVTCITMSAVCRHGMHFIRVLSNQPVSSYMSGHVQAALHKREAEGGD